MKKKLLILIPVLILITACSSKNYFIVPEYEDMKIQNSELLIPTVNEFKIRHTENIFTEDELAQINKKFVTALSENLMPQIQKRTAFKKINFADFGERLERETRDLPYQSGETIHITVPKNKLAINSPDRTTILFLDNMSLAIFRKEMETSDPRKHYSISSAIPTEPRLSPLKLSNQMFLCEFNYLWYDNTNAKPIAYGLISIEQKMRENMEFDVLINKIIEEIAGTVVKGTPFQK